MAKQQQGQGMAAVALVAVLVVLAATAAETASAASCNAGQLAACAPAITAGARPSASCCSNLKAQQGCFCQFVKNPTYGRYINSPNARKVVASCGVSVPRC
jgi:curli biogenesis system outer membrane secretion channel CsgG